MLQDLLTSKLAITCLLGAAAYFQIDYLGDRAPLALVLVLWGMLAAAVIGRTLRQMREDRDE